MTRTSKSTELTREQLYKKIWTTPAFRLCHEFGISSRGLGKLCERWEIPVPPRGYWRRVETGERPKRTPLPPLPQSGTIRIKATPEMPKQNGKLEIIVPDRLSDPHELVTYTREARNTDPSGGEQSLDLRVSKEALPRALRIVDTLIKTFERRGHEVRIEGYRNTSVIFDKEKVRFYIEERYKQHVVEYSKAERERRAIWPPYEMRPTGRLTLRIDGRPQCGRYGWSDGAKRRIENMLPEFISVVERYAVELDERTRQQREERKRQEEARRIREAEQQKENTLKKQLELMRTIRDLEDYFEFAESYVSKSPESWLIWGRGQLDACRTSLARSIEQAEALVFGSDG